MQAISIQLTNLTELFIIILRYFLHDETIKIHYFQNLFFLFFFNF